jgi:carotenoid cleavage dioxygenase-like enzyme
MGYVIDTTTDTIPHRIPPGFHGNWMPATV